MKIRADFITNSSSSSFVIGFKSINSIKDELEQNMAHTYAERVNRDIDADDLMDSDEAVNLIKEENEFHAAWIAGDRSGKSYTETLQWMETDEGKAGALKVLNEIVEKVKERMRNYSVFAVVEYEDHSQIGYELEHEILPKNPNTIIRLSHH